MASATHRSLYWVCFSVFALLILGGCGGSTGDQGPQGVEGPPGPAGPPGIVREVATSLHINITGVTINNGPPVVNFTVTDQNGNGFPGVPVSTLEVTIAQLIPGTNGDTDHWQNYINSVRQSTATNAPEPSAIQPGRDSGGTLVDNGDGSYAYTLGTDITNITQPIAVAYDPTLTHRVAIAIRSSSLPSADNGIYTWQPSTGATTGIPEAAVIETASCNACHNELSAHGGPRKDVRMCETCHNPGNSDPNTGNSLDFRVMIHKIHDGENLPSVLGGTPYIIYGFGNSIHDFSDVVFPQDVRNCEKCHDAANPNTPDAKNHFEHPSIQACGACHDDVDFAAGISGGHPGGVVTDNSQCTVCHAQGRIAGSVEESHVIPGKVAAQDFKYNILSITNTAPGQTPVVKFSITNPNNNNAPYNIQTDPAFTASGGVSRLAIDIAWSTSDYTNMESGNPPGLPISINALSSATSNGDGTFTVTSPTTIPTDVTGSGAVAIEGHPAGDFDGDGTFTDRIPVTSAVQYFAITDPQPVQRRDVVDVANCQKCHGQNDGLSLHGGNRTDNVHLCVICHNPNDTDINQRPVDPDMTANGVNTAAADGLEQRPIDFKRMIHAIHGADFRTTDFVVYGFGGSVNDFADVRFPGILKDCNTCHVNKTFEPPLGSNVLGTTVDTHATVGSSGLIPIGAITDTANFNRITATASVCSACHDDPVAKAHMVQNGASFSTTQSLIDSGNVTESCALCHGAGRIEDVEKAHDLQ